MRPLTPILDLQRHVPWKRRDAIVEAAEGAAMPRATPRPVAFLIEAVGMAPAVMLDHAKAVEFAAFKHGTTSPLVRESLLLEALARIQELEDRIANAAGV